MGGRHNNNRRITSVFNNPGRNKTAGELYYLERNGSENMPESMLILKIELGKMRLRELAERYGREDRRVLKYSQKLDNLIAELMQRRLAG